MILHSTRSLYASTQPSRTGVWHPSTSIAPIKALKNGHDRKENHDIIKSAHISNKSSDELNGIDLFVEKEGLMLHEFQWKHDGDHIILTGTFDQWKKTIIMERDNDTGYFSAAVLLDPRKTWAFKFIVDDVWRCSLDFSTELDAQGNVNNVIYPL